MERLSLLETLVAAAPALGRGLAMTVQLAVTVIPITLLTGILAGIGMVYGGRILAALLRLYVDFIRGVPALAIIFSVYYLLPLTGIAIAEYAAAVLALSVFFFAHVTETARGAIQSVPRAQVEAAKAIGLRPAQRLRYVILPQALRRFLPPWINTVVETVKGTALLSLLGIVDLMLATQQIVGRTFEAMLFYTVTAAIYIAINFTLSWTSRALERRFAYVTV